MSLSVSVVIPTFNRAAEVLQAVHSVLAQTYPAHEIWIVDDGSTDDTHERVRALPAPVRYLRKPNGGVSSARNAGFREASGDCIALLDSDDKWEPGWLEQAVQALEHDLLCGSVCSLFRVVDISGKHLRISNLAAIASGGSIPLPALFEHRIALGSNLCTRRSVLDAAGHFDESLATAEDVDLALRLAAIAPLRLIEEPLILVTNTAGSLSANLNTGNRLRVFGKFAQLHPSLAAQYRIELRDARAKAALSYALDLTVARKLVEARKRALESWRYRPSMAAAKLLAKILLLHLLTGSRNLMGAQGR